MAKVVRWRYSRVPAWHPRIMHPSYPLGKAERPAGGRMVPGGRETDTCRCRERDTGGSEDADSVVSDKIGDTSIDEETSIINKGGDSPGGGAPTGMVLDSDGESILNREKGGLKANGIQEGSDGLPVCTRWPCG
jgi:hypothetical protein